MKKKMILNGQTIEIGGSRGPAGPDGNPIGTIISYMGLTAPKDYLICDGAVYDIADYSDLTEFFEEQFGSKNYFGGDGEITFAVPDMRNLFLRGYHCDAEEQFSGEVGERQEATEIPFLGYSSRYLCTYPYEDNSSYWNPIRNTDKLINGTKNIATYNNTKFSFKSDATPSSYSARPVNMAVLYCIKATETKPSENIYSTEETRIGRWIDGRPLYSRGFEYSIVTSDRHTVFPIDDFPIEIVDEIVKQYGTCISIGDAKFNIGSNLASFMIESGTLVFIQENSTRQHTYVGTAIFEYTKTTDSATIELPTMLSAKPIAVTAAPASAASAAFNIGNEDITDLYIPVTEPAPASSASFSFLDIKEAPGSTASAEFDLG